MRLTLELNTGQSTHLKKALESTLASLVWQETECKDALDRVQTPEHEKNLQEYLVEVSCQRVIVAEILGTMNEAEPEHQILAETWMPEHFKNPKDAGLTFPYKHNPTIAGKKRRKE